MGRVVCKVAVLSFLSPLPDDVGENGIFVAFAEGAFLVLGVDMGKSADFDLTIRANVFFGRNVFTAF